MVRGEVEARNEKGRRRIWVDESARVRVGEAPRMVMPLKAVVLGGPSSIIERQP